MSRSRRRCPSFALRFDDGVNDKEGWLLELKGTSNFAGVQRSGVMAAHKKQTQAYLLASATRCVVIYECKSSQQWAEFEVERDDEIAAEITAILTELNHAIDSGEMPEVLDDCKNQTGTTFARCPYASHASASGAPMKSLRQFPLVSGIAGSRACVMSLMSTPMC